MKQIRIAAALVFCAAFCAAPARAQVFTPPFQSPIPTSDFGVYVSDLGDVAIEGIWRRLSRGGADVGVRVGYADVGDGALLAGLEARSPVILAGAPIGLAFTASGQGIVGDRTRLGGQVGFSAGQALPTGTFPVTPYIHPRLVVVAIPDADEAAGEENLDVDVRADIGADFTFASGIALRADINLAEGASWGLGVAWRF